MTIVKTIGGKKIGCLEAILAENELWAEGKDYRDDYIDEFNILARLEGWERAERLIKQQLPCGFRAIMQPSHALAMLGAAEQLCRDMTYVAGAMDRDSDAALAEYHLNALSAYSDLGKDNIEKEAEEAAREDWFAEGWDEVEEVSIELADRARNISTGVKALREQIEKRVCHAEQWRMRDINPGIM